MTDGLRLAASKNVGSSPYLCGDTDWNHDVDTVDLIETIVNHTSAIGSNRTRTVRLASADAGDRLPVGSAGEELLQCVLNDLCH